jgi:hypothetical protein
MERLKTIIFKSPSEIMEYKCPYSSRFNYEIINTVFDIYTPMIDEQRDVQIIQQILTWQQKEVSAINLIKDTPINRVNYKMELATLLLQYLRQPAVRKAQVNAVKK